MGGKVLGSRSGKGLWGQRGPGFSASRKLCDSMSTELPACYAGTDLWAQVTAEGIRTPACLPLFTPS